MRMRPHCSVGYVGLYVVAFFRLRITSISGRYSDHGGDHNRDRDVPLFSGSPTEEREKRPQNQRHLQHKTSLNSMRLCRARLATSESIECGPKKRVTKSFQSQKVGGLAC